MAELRYQEGKNFAFDFVKIASGAGYETAYRELVARNVDILVAGGPEIALKSTKAIPIVMIAIDYDSFARGYVTSLAQPGGRSSGFLRDPYRVATFEKSAPRPSAIVGCAIIALRKPV